MHWDTFKQDNYSTVGGDDHIYMHTSVLYVKTLTQVDHTSTATGKVNNYCIIIDQCYLWDY